MRRGKERRINSWELLGIAKQMIEEVSESYLLQQIESKFNIEQKYGLRARFEDKNQGQKIVQVILLMRRTKPGNKITWWFYSVHYRR